VALGTTWGDVLAYCAAEDALYIGTTDGRVEAVRPPVVCSEQTSELPSPPDG
jgi:hypothetical protein